MDIFSIEYTSQYKKDLKKAKKSSKDMSKLREILGIIIKGKTIPTKYKDHPLKGNFRNFRELHIEPDWLLIYKILKKEKVLSLVRMGSHSELFN